MKILLKWFDILNYDPDLNRPLPIGKNKKVIGLMEDELGGKIMTEFVALRTKVIFIEWIMTVKPKRRK